MGRKGISVLAAGLAFCLALCAVSCDKAENNFVIPLPDTKPSTGTQTTTPQEPGDPAGGGGGGTTTPGTLCTDIGKTPIVLAYYTEYSTELPDVTLLTHINYAHGRFKNPKTGDGGIEIAEPSKLRNIVALKGKNPDLKVMLMIGGWGGHADGFSMMARDPEKRTAFCKAVKAHIDNYKLDGVDIDWEYPTQSADNTYKTIWYVQEAVDGGYGNSGLEGITWYKDGMMYIGAQTGANLWTYKEDGTKVSMVSLRKIASGIKEVADLCYDPDRDWLWVIDSTVFKIYLFSGDASELLAEYDISGVTKDNPESICVDHANSCVWIADDAQQSKLFKIAFTGL